MSCFAIVLILLIYIKDPFELNLCVTKGFCEEALGNWRKHCEATSQITSRLVSKDQVVEFWIGAILKAKILVFHYYQNLTILPGFDITIPIYSLHLILGVVPLQVMSPMNEIKKTWTYKYSGMAPVAHPLSTVVHAPFYCLTGYGV